ncbi:hypothetical protein I8F73_04325 [Enterococcus faecalis]|nr:hypothetical protein [Enterococcus faecalis]
MGAANIRAQLTIFTANDTTRKWRETLPNDGTIVHPRRFALAHAVAPSLLPPGEHRLNDLISPLFSHEERGYFQGTKMMPMLSQIVEHVLPLATTHHQET